MRFIEDAKRIRRNTNKDGVKVYTNLMEKKIGCWFNPNNGKTVSIIVNNSDTEEDIAKKLEDEFNNI